MFDLSKLGFSVGNMMENQKEDVLRVKKKLHGKGFFDTDTPPEPHGIITRAMDAGIKAFQKENNLKIDGILHPGGETENALFGTRPPVEEDRGTVGFGGNVSGTLMPEKPKRKRKRPLGTTIFVPDYDEQGDNGLTKRLPTLNKNRIAEALEEYLLAQTGQTEKLMNAAAAEDKPDNADATGRITHTESTPPAPERKPVVPETKRPSFDLKEAPVVNLEEERIDSLLNNTPARFDIKFKKTDKILKEAAIDTFVRDNDIAHETVEQHSDTVEQLSKKHGVDPDLVKAIMWDENARGDKWGFNRLLDPVSSSQRPMNIKGSMWSGLIGKESCRLHNPEENIEASVILIKRISDRIEKPTPGKIASIWHFVGRENTDEFGNDVDIIYNQKPWKRKK